MRYVQLMLTNSRRAAISQQLVVVQQRTCYGILDGQHANGRGVLLHLLKHLLKSGTTD
jgi:hypothetical protein